MTIVVIVRKGLFKSHFWLWPLHFLHLPASGGRI